MTLSTGSHSGNFGGYFSNVGVHRRTKVTNFFLEKHPNLSIFFYRHWFPATSSEPYLKPLARNVLKWPKVDGINQAEVCVGCGRSSAANERVGHRDVGAVHVGAPEPRCDGLQGTCMRYPARSAGLHGGGQAVFWGGGRTPLWGGMGRHGGRHFQLLVLEWALLNPALGARAWSSFKRKLPGSDPAKITSI